MGKTGLSAVSLFTCALVLLPAAASANALRKKNLCPAHSESQVGRAYQEVCEQTIVTYQQMQRQIPAEGTAAAPTVKNADELVGDALGALTANAQAIERMKQMLAKLTGMTAPGPLGKGDDNGRLHAITDEMVKLEGAIAEHEKVLLIGKDVYGRLALQYGKFPSAAAALEAADAKLSEAVVGMGSGDVVLANYDPASQVEKPQVTLKTGKFEELYPKLNANGAGGGRDVLRHALIESVAPTDFGPIEADPFAPEMGTAGAQP